ncbi:MAG: AAA family ATPase, partial [Proteobacteria bacterium]|nr:AAA family ATPase [Pseudomonadota bacterium]
MVWDEQKKESNNWLEDNRETIMIYGLPKHGKTYAYCSVIEHILNKQGKVYVISTDSGFIRTAKAYFGDKIKDVYKNINLELVYDINGIRNYYNEIKGNLKKNDLLVIDLLSSIWEWAQIAFAEEFAHGDIQNFMVLAMKDSTKFGMFDSNKWNYIKGLHKFVEDIIIRKPCNFVGVCDEKDTKVELIKGGTKTQTMLENIGFDELTTRPGGMKLLPYQFETIIRIGMEQSKYFMQVVGDRG